MDSCASALLLREMGYEPVGVRLLLHDNGDEKDKDRLKNLESMGIEVVEVDGRGLFKAEVIEPFLQDYGRAVTPNPCVMCNERAKLRMLFEEADKRGIDLVATGHYVRSGEQDGRKALYRGAFLPKDQSYMLYRVPYKWVSRLIFPLGEMEKDEARRYLSLQMGSHEMGQGDSQDICFIDDNLNDFITSNLEPSPKPGDMISTEGRILGRHKGLCLYTEGQRKGLGLGDGPWFVVKKEVRSNSLVLGRDDDIQVRRIKASNLRWQQDVRVGACYDIQHRYRSRPQVGKLISLEEDRLEVLFDHPATGVSVGQSLVFYDGLRLLGGGVIDWVANY